MVRGIKRAETVFESEWGGEWCAMTFWNKATDSEQVALVKGLIDPGRPTLVRMHALSPFADLFGEAGERGGVLRQSMRIIGEEGAGVVVVINRPQPGGLTLAIHARSGTPMPDVEELRNYGVGAMILNERGVEVMVVLTNTHHTLVGLDGYGLRIVGERPLHEHLGRTGNPGPATKKRDGFQESGDGPQRQWTVGMAVREPALFCDGDNAARAVRQCMLDGRYSVLIDQPVAVPASRYARGDALACRVKKRVK